MKTYHSSSKGFTIVELLIVVVVIAILAAITIVSYNGITNRANDTAVQSDVSNMAKKLSIYYADKGQYPDTNVEADVASALTGFKASRGAYFLSGTNVNLIYCTNLPARDQFAVMGWSKTTASKGFIATNNASVRPFNFDLSAGGSSLCASAGIPSNIAWMWLYDLPTTNNKGWRDFI